MDKEKQNHSNLNSCLIIHPEKSEILNISEDISINDGTKVEEETSENQQNSGIENEKLNKSCSENQKKNPFPKDSEENIKKTSQKKNTNSDSEISINTLEKNSNKSKLAQIKLKKNQENKDIAESNFNIEKIEKSKGNSYKENAIDFIKYALFFSALEKQITLLDELILNFENELLQKGDINPDYLKDSIQLDLVVKNLSKKELEKFLDNLKNNIFLKEKLNLGKFEDTQNFDLLIDVEKNYFSQSQDKYSQLYSYIALIKIMNLIKNQNENDQKIKDNYINICNKLKVSENNEKIFVLITDGSYHLLSQIIQFSKKNKYEDIKAHNVIQEKESSFDYKEEVDNVLSKLIENTSLSKIFAKTKNNRNIPNLNKVLNILSDLEHSDIPHCIIYYEDELKISMDNQILNEIIYQLKYNKYNFEKNYNEQFKEIEKKLIERDY